MDTKLALGLGAAVIGIVLIMALFMMGPSSNNEGVGGQSGGAASTIDLTSYWVSASPSSPLLHLQFSRALSGATVITLTDSSGNTVCVQSYEQSPGNTVVLSNIVPPNLMGTYTLNVEEGGKTVLKKTLNFPTPTLNLVNYDVDEYGTDTSKTVVFLNLTIHESGKSPFYYNTLGWEIEGEHHEEYVSTKYLAQNTDTLVSIPLSKELSTGEHTITVHFIYNGEELNIAVNFTV